MLNIYQLADEYLRLADKLADTVDEDGVVDMGLLPVVSEAKELVETKAMSIGAVVKQLRMYMTQIDEEVNRLTAMRKTLDGRIDYLIHATSAVLQECGIDRIESVHTNISFRASEQTIIDDESEIPAEYKTTKITTSPDKTKIKSAIKSGTNVPGAHIESKRNIQIK